MNIQDFLLTELKKGNDYEKAFSDSKVKGAEIDYAALNSKSTGGVREVPMLQSHFILQIDVPGQEKSIMLLKRFNFPEAGIVFDFSQENMWYPTPKVSVQELQLEGYVFYGDIHRSIMGIYHNQFVNGLLNINSVCPTITLSQVQVYEGEDTDVSALGPATAALKALIAGFQGGVAAVSVATDVYDVMEDFKVIAQNKLAMKSPLGFDVRPMMSFKRCNFSAPSLNPDPASNDFVTVSMKVAYRSFETLSDVKAIITF